MKRFVTVAVVLMLLAWISPPLLGQTVAVLGGARRLAIASFTGDILPTVDAVSALGNASHGFITGYFSGTGDGDGTGGISFSTQAGPSVNCYPYASGDFECDAGSVYLYLTRNATRSGVAVGGGIQTGTVDGNGVAGVGLILTGGPTDAGHVRVFTAVPASSGGSDYSQTVLDAVAYADAVTKYYNPLLRQIAYASNGLHPTSLFEIGSEGNLADNGTVTHYRWYGWCFQCDAGVGRSIWHMDDLSPNTWIFDDQINLLVSGGTFMVSGTEGADGLLTIRADQGDDATDSWQFKASASDNGLTFVNNTVAYFSLTTAGLQTVKAAQTTATTFASLMTCNSGTKGTLQYITDSNTATWGATAAAGGANNVGVQCNGTNWTVVSK